MMKRRWSMTVAVALLLLPSPIAEAAPARPARPARGGAVHGVGPGPTVAPDPALSALLDVVVADGPITCLTVAIDGTPIYEHGDAPLTPASVQKLTTAAAALDLLGPDFRFRTRAVTAVAPTPGGTVTGDLTLVGSGDPQLLTGSYRAYRKVADDRVVTSLDALADQVVASGMTRVTGRVVGDESRYDDVRTVPSWPARYVSQEQAGPLSALDVDNGYVITAEGDTTTRRRAERPAANAAAAFTALLRIKGVRVDGDADQGTAPATAVEVASITSDPLSEIVADMLAYSDNHSAEMLAKELGVSQGSGGSTAAGVAAITQWRIDHQLAAPGVTTVDGSGLDPTDAETCANIVALLDGAGGRSGLIAAGLPIAGTTGTLKFRFRDTAATGRLRAKTGTLANVTSLAGFVDLPGGGTATFAYVANGAPVDGPLLAKQDLLAGILSGYRAPCPPPTDHQVLAPLAAYAAQVGALQGAPALAVSIPGTVASLAVAERQLPLVADRCLADDPAASVDLGG